MIQIARNLTDGVDGFFQVKRYLIHDRDPLYTQQFRTMLGEAGIEFVKLLPRAPNLNAYARRLLGVEEQELPIEYRREFGSRLGNEIFSRHNYPRSIRFELIP